MSIVRLLLAVFAAFLIAAVLLPMPVPLLVAIGVGAYMA